MRGKKMPQIGPRRDQRHRGRAVALARVQPEGARPRWRSRPRSGRRQSAPTAKLKPEWQERNVTLFRAIDPDIIYAFFNFRDPLVGGFSKEKIALRRAIIMAYDYDEEIRVIRKGQAVRAIMPIPTGVVGHDPNWKPLNNYDPALANKLLDYFDYKKGKDGYRTLPDGKPLVLRLATGTRRPTASSTSCGRRTWMRSVSASSSSRASSPIT